MQSFIRLGLVALAVACIAIPASAQKKAVLSLVPIATYDTGLGADGAEIISVRDKDGIVVLTNIDGSIDVLDLARPGQPVLLLRVPVDTTGGTPNSVAMHPHHDYFLTVVGRAGATGVVQAYRLSDGELLATATVGIQPDSIAIAPNGQYAVVANEAEGVAVGNDGGVGSLSVVDLSGFTGDAPGVLPVTPVPLPSLAGYAGFSAGRTDDLARLPIDNTPANLEPESVTFSHNSRYAYVTLQENNGVARLDMRSGELSFFGLGQTTHAADLSTTGGYLPADTLTAYREPDGIALDVTGRFFVTADEGDTRNAAGGSGPRGGRTLSVFDAQTGAYIADTGSQLDDAAAAAGIYPDARSNRGGSEPEVLDLTHFRGRTLVAIGLERANAVALIDVTNPAEPVVAALAPTGAGPEGIKFLRRGSDLYVVTANEVAGTVSVFEVAFGRTLTPVRVGRAAGAARCVLSHNGLLVSCRE